VRSTASVQVGGGFIVIVPPLPAVRLPPTLMSPPFMGMPPSPPVVEVEPPAPPLIVTCPPVPAAVPEPAAAPPVVVAVCPPPPVAAGFPSALPPPPPPPHAASSSPVEIPRVAARRSISPKKGGNAPQASVFCLRCHTLSDWNVDCLGKVARGYH